MEIPHTVTARPDTGLWNAKLGIWLFLASEVMLFGGLFSGYIFLRLGANAEPEYFWPENALPVLPGFINTLVLIASSVTVVMAWAALKMRNWKKYTYYMGFTLLCSLAFLCIKAYEYNGKFKHYGFRLHDGSILEGHIHEKESRVGGVSAIEAPRSALSELPDVLKNLQPASQGGQSGHSSVNPLPITPGTLLQEFGGAKQDQVEGAQHILPAGKVDSGHHKQHGGASHSVATAKPKFLVQGSPTPVEVDGAFIKQWLKNNPQQEKLRLVPTRKYDLSLHPDELGDKTEDGVTLANGVQVEGAAPEDFFHLAVDQLDMRALAVRIDENLPQKQREEALWKSLSESDVFDYVGAEQKKEFLHHAQEQIAEFKKEEPDYDALSNLESVRLAFLHHLDKVEHDGKKEYPHVTLPAKAVQFFSNLTPKWNTYYAIYFTLTGLHGLHVIGGAIVLAYFLFRGKELYKKNPEHLANRVEVGGLFWHFVDLVWIFLFPIMYLL